MTLPVVGAIRQTHSPLIAGSGFVGLIDEVLLFEYLCKLFLLRLMKQNIVYNKQASLYRSDISMTGFHSSCYKCYFDDVVVDFAVIVLVAVRACHCQFNIPVQ